MFPARGTIGNSLFFVPLLLALFGLIMTYSASWAYSEISYDNSYYMLLKQAVALILGLGALVLFSKMNHQKLLQASELFLLFFIFLTGLTLLPGLSAEGRWLDLGPLSFQPTEGLKLALILWLSYAIPLKGEKIRNFKEGILPFVLALAFIGMLTISQPDFGMTTLYIAVAGFMLFVGGARIWDLTKVALMSLPLLGGLALMAPYRLDRLMAFLRPGANKMDESYQLIQSLVAFGSGGVWGRGLGRSAEKFLYLPSAYNDFIYSIVGEELGFLGALAVLFLFLYFGFRGFQLALRCKEKATSLLASGLTFIIVWQALLNFCVTLGVLPVTGLTLPFISYGGSSLIVSLAMVGVLISISNWEERQKRLPDNLSNTGGEELP